MKSKEWILAPQITEQRAEDWIFQPHKAVIMSNRYQVMDLIDVLCELTGALFLSLKY